MARRMIHMPADTDLNHLFDVWSLADRLLAEHGLKTKDWKVVFDNTKHRGGQCRYREREIGLSAHLMAIWEFEHCQNTIAHEIAHALVRPKLRSSGRWDIHSKEWRAKFLELGGNGKTRWGSDGEKRIPSQRKVNWIGTCPKGHTRGRTRKPLAGRNYSCGTCAPGRYDNRYQIVWRKA